MQVELKESQLYQRPEIYTFIKEKESHLKTYRLVLLRA